MTEPRIKVIRNLGPPRWRRGDEPGRLSDEDLRYWHRVWWGEPEKPEEKAPEPAPRPSEGEG